MWIMVFHHKKHMIDTYAVSVILTFGLVLEKVFWIPAAKMRQNPRWRGVETGQYSNKFRTTPGVTGGPKSRWRYGVVKHKRRHQGRMGKLLVCCLLDVDFLGKVALRGVPEGVEAALSSLRVSVISSH